MTKIVFHCFSAYVGSVTGRTTCAFWPDDPNNLNWDPKKLVKVDLAATPSAARAGKIKWSDVQCDDHTINGGLTTIGALFPSNHVIGACWLSEDYMKTVGLTTASKPQHAHDHELRAIFYDKDPSFGDRRFQGFHARVLGSAPAAGQALTRAQIWSAGMGKAGGFSGVWWIDLADISDQTESDVGAKGALEGSLYIDTDKKQSYTAAGGGGLKIPPAYGYGD